MEYIKFILTAFLMIFINVSLSADSVADKAKSHRSKNMHAIVFLEVPIKNFGTDAQKSQYKTIKFQYGRALAFFFEDDFIRSYNAFLTVQKSLEKIYEKLSIEYISRTEVILQEALQVLVEVDIKYHPKADIINRMLTDIEPPIEKPYYEEKEFHFVYDKKTMTANIDRAYYLLGHAKRLRRKSINLIKNLEDGQPIPHSYRGQKVENYRKIIEICRAAKKNGIRVHQYINRNKIYMAEPSHRKNPTFKEKKLDPIFDTRISRLYILDLNDAYNRKHDTEINYKILLKKYQAGK